MSWHKVWVVARHEYLTNVRRAGFIIMTAIVPALGVLALMFGAFFAGQARQLGDFFRRQFDIGDKAIGVVDQSG
jgi:ABC-type Na+ efflux pump permease subunit